MSLITRGPANPIIASGSEIIMSGITIPDMLKIVKAHDLNVVPVDINMETLQVDEASVANAITDKTVMVVIAHLFGARMDMNPVYNALVDRPDILQILSDNGIRWVRTNARDYRDCQPTPFSEQPFFYVDQGFSDILELGVQGYQDDFCWDRFDDRQFGDTYQDYLFAMLEKVANEKLVWNVCSHDHGTIDMDSFSRIKGDWIEMLIIQAKSLGIQFGTPPDLYEQMAA